MSEFVEPEMKVVKPGEAITFCNDDACPLNIPAAKADGIESAAKEEIKNVR